jgi:hypothetical protein
MPDNQRQTAAQSISGLPCRRAQQKLLRTRARKPSDPASRPSSFQLSDENRDGGRAFSLQTGKADSVSPFPARIAPQGEERAGADATHVPCPREKRAYQEAISGNLFGRPTSPGLLNQLQPSLRLEPCWIRSGTPIHYRHTKRRVLANLLTVSRKSGEVNALQTPPDMIFSEFN